MTNTKKKIATIAVLGIQLAPAVLQPLTVIADNSTTITSGGDIANVGEIQDAKSGLTQVVTVNGYKLYDKVTVNPGDTVNFDVVVTPGNQSLLSEFKDTLPEGLSFADGNKSLQVYAVNNDGSIGANVTAEGDIKVQGQVVTWTPKNPAEYIFAGKQGRKNRLVFRVSTKVSKDATHENVYVNNAESTWKNPKIPNDPGTKKQDQATVAVREKTQINKEASADDQNYTPAATKKAAVNFTRKDSTWNWRMKVKLSNNIDYTSLAITDVLEDVQQVDLKSVHVYDWNGQDVTAKGQLQEQPAVNGQRRIVWTANQDFLKQMNKEFGSDHQDLKPTMTMKFKATAAKTENSKLIKYLDTESNRVVIPNTASVEGRDKKGGVVVNSNTSHIKFFLENNVSNPEKKVTDLNETNVDRNNLGVVDRHQKYDITFNTSRGSGFSKLNVVDKLPTGFTPDDVSKVKITNSAGKDLRNLFDYSIKNGVFSASIKKEGVESPDLNETTVRFEISGTAVRWLGGTIKNKATVEDFDKHLETGETVTVIPKDGSAQKESSADNTTFNKAETDATATKVNEFNSSYFWKNTFTLPNLTDYTNVTLTDVFESVQAVEQSKIHVLDKNGQDVTNRGQLTIADKNSTQKEIKWTANADYLAELNTAYGAKSDQHPQFTFNIETTVKDVELSKLDSYKNAAKEYIIPNTASMAVRDNSGIKQDYKIDTNISKVNIPSKVVPNSPTKTVSDSNQIDVKKNNVGLESLSQTYKISAKTTAGYKLSRFNIKDQLPKDFKTSVEQVKVTNSAGKDVKNLFNVTLDENNQLVANLKDSAKSNKDVIDTTVTLAVQGVFPDGYGQKVNNTGHVYGPIGNYDTDPVESAIPSKPKSVKSVSNDGGKSFTTDANLVKRSDEYIWKLEYELANLTNYSDIQLVDKMENLQAVHQDKIHVYDIDGKDVTKRGTIKITQKSGKNEVVWIANKELVDETNKRFGADSVEKPKFTMQVATNVQKASSSDEVNYFDQALGQVKIPNEGEQRLVAASNEGKAVTKSNKAHVILPKPGEGSAKKYVSLDGDNPNWSDKLELPTFDTKYQYRTEFKLADNFNFDSGSLSLTDTYENLQSYDSVKMTDASGADITGKFDIKTEKVKEKTKITATPKNANDFDDTGATVNMVIRGATLNGATGEQQAKYLVGENDESGFKQGVVIPNISHINMESKIPNYSQKKDSNKTFVNFNLSAYISKSAENEMKEVVNPKDATKETSLSDLVASAQKLLSDVKNKDAKKLKELSDLILKNPTKDELYNKLISFNK